MKTETKRTPGPWHHHDIEEMTVCGPDHSCVARTDASDRGLNENEANARLIASAPDLLVAVNGLLISLADARTNGYEIVGTTRAERFAKAAIAKATQ